MLTDPSGFKEKTVIDVLPSKDIEIGDIEYTCYLEKNPSETDRCFAFTFKQEPEQIFLFQITDALADKNVSKGSLQRINLEDYESMYVLVKTGLSIIKELPKEITRFDVTRRHIPLNQQRYTVSYQSPNIEMAGTSLYDRYSNKVIARQNS